MLTPTQTLDEYSLEVRCKLLEIAAILDRYDRACGREPDAAVNDDPRLARFRRSLAVLSRPANDAQPRRAGRPRLQRRRGGKPET